MIVKTMSGVFDEIIKIPSRVNFPSLPGKKDTNKEVGPTSLKFVSKKGQVL